MFNMNPEAARLWADTPPDAPGQGRAAAPEDVERIKYDHPAMSGEWLSVAEAVAYCAGKGLIRNIKTVRRWAHRSFAHPESAEVMAVRQDTETDFRYVIERSSLDVKIAQELEFEAKQRPSAALAAAPWLADKAGQGQVGPGMDAGSPALSAPSLSERTDADRPADVRAGADAAGQDAAVALKVRPQSPGDDDFLKTQIAEKDRQIGNLHRQLERRDEQIMAMLERDRETNILIKGLQEALLPASSTLGEAPARRLAVRSLGLGEKPEGETADDAVE